MDSTKADTNDSKRSVFMRPSLCCCAALAREFLPEPPAGAPLVETQRGAKMREATPLESFCHLA